MKKVSLKKKYETADRWKGRQRGKEVLIAQVDTASYFLSSRYLILQDKRLFLLYSVAWVFACYFIVLNTRYTSAVQDWKQLHIMNYRW